VAYEVSGASRRNYSRSEDTGEMNVSRVNARESRGRLFEEVRLFFLPEGFPDSVGHSYAAYTCWRFLQNVISSMTAVLSTQALLSAVGIGPGASQSVAAATSWVLKDGFGSVGKLITARMGVAFDSESKMYRLSSDILFDLGISLELVTPLFPQQFLLLAAMGNFVKSVSMTIGMACRNSVLATFVLRENLGDISAKNDAQNTIANLLGLGAGIGVARVLPEKTSLRLATFWALTSVYSLINYQSMKSVTLRTLNRQRAGIAIDEFIRGNPIPTPEYVNRHERIVPFVKPRFAEPHLRLGAPLSSLEDGLETMVAAAKKHGDRFIIDLSPNQVNIVLHQDAKSDDILQAYLAYSHTRRVLGDRLNDGRCRGVSMFTEKRRGCVPTARRIWTSVDPANRFKKLEESKQYARKNLRRLKQALSEAGYNTKILLFAPDRVRAFF
jgi:Vitamin B6 photo-protection and homoeostasis